MDKHNVLHVIELIMILALFLFWEFVPIKTTSVQREFKEPPPQFAVYLNTTDDRIRDLTNIGCAIFTLAALGGEAPVLYNATNALQVHAYADFRRIAYNTRLVYVGNDMLFTTIDGVIIILNSPPATLLVYIFFRGFFACMCVEYE